MIISDGAIRIKCINCGVDRNQVGFNLQIHYRWKNKSGCCIRIFCNCCGHVYDVTQLYKNGEAIQKRFVYKFVPTKEIPV